MVEIEQVAGIDEGTVVPGRLRGLWLLLRSLVVDAREVDASNSRIEIVGSIKGFEVRLTEVRRFGTVAIGRLGCLFAGRRCSIPLLNLLWFARARFGRGGTRFRRSRDGCDCRRCRY